MNNINNCNICLGGVSVKYKLKFKYLVGLADEWNQEIAVCPRCGFIFTKNPFDDEQLNDRYKNFSKFEFDDESYVYEEKEDYKIRSVRQQQFLDRNINLKEVNSILEVGAASGYNLSLYQNNGHEVMGIEPSLQNCQNSKKYYGINMFCGTFDEYLSTKDISKKYDLIFLSHVLEHIVNPKDFIEKCASLNKGYMLIEVPTFDYKFADEPFGMFCEEHVNMFTVESLQSLMTACGYELLNAEIILGIEQRLPAGFPAISTIWQKKDALKIKKMINCGIDILQKYICQSEIEMKRIQSIISSIDNKKKLAIWGTGHHVSMLIANTDLETKNIVRVYDSFIKKQGMTFAGCMIQPFTAEDIEEGEIEVILIATYVSQEVILKILEPNKEKVEIITLY